VPLHHLPLFTLDLLRIATLQDSFFFTIEKEKEKEKPVPEARRRLHVVVGSLTVL
jgi:hypothetical protein